MIIMTQFNSCVIIINLKLELHYVIYESDSGVNKTKTHECAFGSLPNPGFRYVNADLRRSWDSPDNKSIHKPIYQIAL